MKRVCSSDHCGWRRVRTREHGKRATNGVATSTWSSHTPSNDNYSGWTSEWTTPSVGDSITTTWGAVPMNCSAGKGEASPWPGMGDTQTKTGTASETNLAQLGYDMDCGKNGKATYTAWTEFIHNGNDPGEVDYPMIRFNRTTY